MNCLGIVWGFYWGSGCFSLEVLSVSFEQEGV
jgi:hypothetical protein